MATFTGTGADETITPGMVSPTVTASGAPAPSNADDVINAGGGNDTVIGGGGNDTINAGDGDDIVQGSQGDDTVNLGSGNDRFIWFPGHNSDTIEGGSGADTLQFDTSAASEDIVVSANGARAKVTRDVASVTTDLNDVERIEIAAMGGMDEITVGSLAGTDVQLVTIGLGLINGMGDGVADAVIAQGAGAKDQIALATTGSTFIVTGLGAEIRVGGGEIAHDRIVVRGLGGNDVINASGVGADLMKTVLEGGDGNDTITGGEGDDEIHGGNNDDTVRGGSGHDAIFLGAGNDTFIWNPGDGLGDVIDGGAGTDTAVINLLGGSGSYGVAPNGPGGARVSGDILTELAAIEHVVLKASHAFNKVSVGDLGGTGVTRVSVELAKVAGGAWDRITVHGNDLKNTIAVKAADGAVVVSGLAAETRIINADPALDLLYVRAGGDDDVIDARGLPAVQIGLKLEGGLGNDTIRGSAGGDEIDGGVGADTLFGNGGIDTASYASSTSAVNVNLASGAGVGGEAAGDLLQGIENVTGSGFNDTLTGDAGNNIFAGGAGADAIDGGAGIDTVSYVNSDTAVIASLQYAGSKGHAEGDVLVRVENLVGSIGNDVLAGSTGDNLLIGGWGADTLNGGLGIDTAGYADSNAAVTVNLATGLGFGGHAEGDILQSIESVIGSAFNDTLVGNSAANRLDGGRGADVMRGADGNDTYVVDNAGDTVIENSGGGADTVRVAFAYTLGANVENLMLTGSRAVNGAGNGLANTLTGNGAANVLDGKGGDDTMAGKGGNDTYIVDRSADKVVEIAGEGADTVRSSATFTLGANVERLVLTGTAAINGTGNGQANQITGNGAANILDGKGGNDRMEGGNGDDTYVVDSAGDTVIESAGGGNDTVVSAVAWTLGAGVEDLTLVGAASPVAKGAVVLTGVGNDLGNRLKGSDAADSLSGGLGDDTLSGGLGRDKLAGGRGKDFFLFDAALGKANADKILGYTGKDMILLDGAVFSGLAPGKLGKKAFSEGAAGDGSDRIILDGKGRIFFDADGKGGEKALLFAKVGKDVDLSAGDFLVI